MRFLEFRVNESVIKNSAWLGTWVVSSAPDVGMDLLGNVLLYYNSYTTVTAEC